MPRSIDATVALPVWAIAGAVLLFAILALILWSLKRRTRVHWRNSFGNPSSLPVTLAGLTQGTIVEGNRVELVQNGAFFDRLFADLEAARSTINFETFLSKEGELTRRLTDLLVGKAAEGVAVRVVLDGSGGRGFGKESLKKLKAAGCRVCKFHPFELRNLGRINNRTHRKIAIVDGRVAYVGGHCLVDTWMGDAEDRKHFRDITARVEGPVVHQVQAAFAENWIEETGDAFGGEDYFAPVAKSGETPAHVVFVSPAGMPSTIKMLHYIAIRSAKKSLTIQNPYFLPDPDARNALVEAAQRGVEVRIMIPAVDATDSAIVQHASHHHYGTLLKGGVRIFEYHRTLLHQKVFAVDSEWCSVGSTNFDDRSFEINDEISLVFHDPQLATQIEAIFEADLAHATEVDLAPWRERPVLHKLQDAFAFLFNEQL